MELDERKLALIRYCCRNDESFRWVLRLLAGETGALPDVEVQHLRRVLLAERLLTATADNISIVGADHCYQYVSPHYTVDYGLEPNEIVGRHVAELIGEEAYQRHARPLLDRCLAGEEVCYEGWLGREPFRRRYRRVSYFPLRDTEDQTEAVLVLSRDITEIVRTVEALRESEDRYRSLVAQAADGILLLDERGRVVEANESACRLTTRQADELLTTPFIELLAEPERARFATDLSRVLEGQRVFLEYQLDTAAPIELSAQHLESGSVLVIFRDISKRKQSEARVHQSQKMEVLGQLAGGVAHDFNNLLTVILELSSQLSRALGADSPHHEDLHDIHGAATRAALLTRQLLAFGSRQVLEAQGIELGKALPDFAGMLRRLLDERVELALCLTSEPCCVEIDRGQLEQLFLNLVVNARDAIAGTGRIEIETELLSAPPDNVTVGRAERGGSEVVCIRVSDTGSGIAPEVLPRIFEPFFSTKPVGEGTGMGLATVYGIIKQSRGDILVTSDGQSGTTFHVYLPFAQPRPSPSVRPPPSVGRAPSSTHRVLVVEDEPTLRRILRRGLSRHGYDVALAQDGEEGLRMAQLDPPDAIVTDVIMPKLGGAAVVETLRQTHPELPAVFISGYAEDGVDALPSDERTRFVPKPFEIDDLARCLAELLPG